MGLLDRLGAPLKGYWLLRRLLAEQRRQTRALERLAAAVELAALPHGTDAQSSRSFRSFSQTREGLNEEEVRAVSEVSYVNERELAALEQKEADLRLALGRDPSPDEVLRAYDGKSLVS